MNGITLTSAEEAFRQWREQRSSRATPIPETLWSMALALYPQYKRSKICHHLRLSGSQFKRRLEKTGSGFVLAAHDELQTTVPNMQLTLQGKERTMTLCFDTHALSQVLPHVGTLL